MNKLYTFNEFLNEARAITYKMPASDFGTHTHGYYQHGEMKNTWRVHGGYAHDRTGGGNPMERDTVFFEVNLMGDKMYIKIGGINNIKRTNASTYGKNFSTTIADFEKAPKGISRAASEFLTDNDHLKWLNQNAKSDGNKVKFVLKDNYADVIQQLATMAINEYK